MTAYLKSLPFGAPGVLSRPHVHTNEPQMVNSAAAPTAYGVPVKMVSGKVNAIAASDAATVVYGFLVRPFPSQDFAFPGDFGSATPPTNGTVSVMRRGYMLVKVNAGTAAPQGTVYMRVAAASGAKVIGGIEAVADSTNTVVVADATFMTAADADGVAEIAYNI